MLSRNDLAGFAELAAVDPAHHVCGILAQVLLHDLDRPADAGSEVWVPVGQVE